MHAAALKATRDQARADADRAKRTVESAGQHLTRQHLRRRAVSARDKMRGRDGGYRRDPLRAPAQPVDGAAHEVRIMGSRREERIRVLAPSNGVQSAANDVRTLVPGWRATRDENTNYSFVVALR